MAALDHVDGVDLDIAQVLHCGRGCLRAISEWARPIQPLGTEPDPGLRLGNAKGGTAIRTHELGV